jgi:anti-sigma factor RsiW
MTRRGDERLSAWLDGELEPRERSALEAELREQPGTAAQLEPLRELERALGELPRVEPGAGFEARFRARLEQELAERRLSWWQRAWDRLVPGSLVGAGAFATAAALIALAVWLGRPEALGPELEQIAEIGDPEAWELLRSEDVELLEVLEILEAWDGVQDT